MEIKSINYQTDTGFTLFQKNKNQANLEALAEEFESMFINQMLKQARDSKLSDGLFDTKSDDNFVQMFDAELAKTSSESVDIGIAEAIIKQMSFHGSES